MNKTAKRALCVIDPVKVVIENYPEGKVEQIKASYYPQDPESDSQGFAVFARTIILSASDFMEDPPKKYFRFLLVLKCVYVMLMSLNVMK